MALSCIQGMVTLNPKYNFKKELISISPFFLTLVLQAQTDCIITVLQSGSCNNINFADDYVDSLARRNKTPHLYYLKGILKDEIHEYAQSIFNRTFSIDQLVTDEQIKTLGLEHLTQFNIAIVVKDNRILHIVDLNEFEEKHLLTLNTKGQNTLFNRFNDVSVIKDSFILNYSKKVRLNPEIRINEQCEILKIDSIIYLMDPLFKHRLYKINANSGNIIHSVSLKELIPYDSVLYCYQQQIKVLAYDTILKYSRILNPDTNPVFYDMLISENQLLLSGAQSIPTLTNWNGYQIMNLNHAVIYKFDLNLGLQNHYLDKFINYSGLYLNDQNISNNSSLQKLQYQVFHNINETFQEKKIIYMGLEDNLHQLKKIGIDTLDIPTDFSGEFYSNDASNFTNLNTTKKPIWLLDPYPYLYFPSDSIYLDLIEGKFIRKVEILKFNSKSNFLNYCVHKTYLNNDELHIILSYRKIIYHIVYNKKNRQIQIEKHPDYKRYNLKILLDNQMKKYFVPLEKDTSNNNYIYFE